MYKYPCVEVVKRPGEIPIIEITFNLTYKSFNSSSEVLSSIVCTYVDLDF
jgi:hypothetical protein